jgi:hypothetical protein
VKQALIAYKYLACAMLDQLLGWSVIFFPFALSILFFFIPTRQENKGAHMKWRIALVVLGFAFSGVAGWQQDRASKTANKEREKAISETATQTSERVTKVLSKEYAEQTKTLRKDYSEQINSLYQKVGILQQQISEQGRDVTTIKQSNIVTGKKAIKVEVINQGVGGANPAISTMPEIHVVRASTRKDEGAHAQIIEWVVQNLGSVGTSAHIMATVLRNGVPISSNNFRDRLDFGPQMFFAMSVEVPETEAESFLLGKEQLAIQLDIRYSSTEHDKLDRHYKYVAQYDTKRKFFNIIQSGLVSP